MKSDIKSRFCFPLKFLVLFFSVSFSRALFVPSLPPPPSLSLSLDIQSTPFLLYNLPPPPASFLPPSLYFSSPNSLLPLNYII